MFLKALYYLISVPARIKGLKFGRNSFIGPGYDFMNVKLKGIELGDDAIVGRNAWMETISTSGQILVGKGTNIGRNATITCKNKITIGEKCLISYNVSIIDHDHIAGRFKSPLEGRLTPGKEIIIGKNCFVGAHSFILKGVHLGQNCFVGANSVVTRSFPDYSLIAGSPAKLIRKIH